LPPPGLRLLAFDDGGMRGLAMLLLLRHVLRKFQQDARLHSLPLPWERFDIIAGCGTGGFIALLLGRLRLSIDRAIECYVRLVEHALTQIKSGGTFKATSLEKVLKEICSRFGGGDETSILDLDPRSCKTFVITREEYEPGRAMLRRLRTYRHPTEAVFNCTFLEAVRATMGNPTFFKPWSVLEGEKHATYLDAGDDHCNPVFALYEEAKVLYPDQDVAYLLSLGPGTADTVGDNPPRIFVNQIRLPSTFLTALRHLADRCDHIASEFQAKYGNFDGRYCRLTPLPLTNDRRILPEQEEILEDLVWQHLTSVPDRWTSYVHAMTYEKALRHDKRIDN
ncbi:acyl transferase/acyl hydrolase/lysophospholipase, partial [Schizophyllum fasciatum]